jgi:hypothetical protein
LLAFAFSFVTSTASVPSFTFPHLLTRPR